MVDANKNITSGLKKTFKQVKRPFMWMALKKNILGILICFLIFAAGFLINGNISLYFNFSALLIVFGGTFGATLICFRFQRIAIVWKVLMSSFRSPVKSPDEVVEILVDLSVKSKLQGFLTFLGEWDMIRE